MEALFEFVKTFLLSVLSMSFTLLIFNLFDDVNDWLKKKWAYLLLMYIVLFICFQFSGLKIIGLIEFPFSFFILVAGFKGKKMSKLFIIVYMLTVTYCLEVTYQILYSIITQSDYSVLLNDVHNYDLQIASFHFSMISAYYYVHFRLLGSNKIKLEGVKRKNIVASILVLIPLTFFLIRARYYFVEIGYLNFNLQTSFLIASIFIVLALVFFVLLSIHMRTLRDQQLNNNYLLKSIVKSKGEHYKRIEVLNREIRKSNHDIHNQLIAIGLLLDKNKLDKAKEYISAMKSKVNDNVNLIESGNNIFDAIINEKAAIAKEQDIDIRFSGMMPENEFIDYLDICSICANSIDNAIDATAKEYHFERNIYIKSEVKNNHWIYNITNPTRGSIVFEGGKVVSSKRNKAFHGFGVENIKASVYKYDGQVQIKNENNEFSLNVIIKI